MALPKPEWAVHLDGDMPRRTRAQAGCDETCGVQARVLLCIRVGFPHPIPPNLTHTTFRTSSPLFMADAERDMVPAV